MKKVRTIVAVAALSSGLLVGTTGCIPEPCQNMSASEKDKQAAADGYEVEREDAEGNTCELSNDGTTWEVDD